MSHIVVRLRERDAKVGIGVDEADFVGKAVLARAGDPQHDAAVGAGGDRDVHEDAGDDAGDDDVVAVQPHLPSTTVGAWSGAAKRRGAKALCFGAGCIAKSLP